MILLEDSLVMKKNIGCSEKRADSKGKGGKFRARSPENHDFARSRSQIPVPFLLLSLCGIMKASANTFAPCLFLSSSVS